MLITGSWDGAEESAEIYHPDIDSACILPELPEQRYYHTQDGFLVCGGKMAPRSCRIWNPDTGAWDLVTESLTEDRIHHNSWTPEGGSATYLIGGYGSGETSEAITKVSSKNHIIVSFPLQNSTV